MQIFVDHRVKDGDVFFVKRESRNVVSVSEDRVRPVKESKVDELVDSILSLGQLENVVAVGGFPEGLKVIAGAHRVAAINKIWDNDLDRDNPIRLQVNRIFIAEKDERLVEIAENLHRNDLSKAERDELTAVMLGEMKNGKNLKTATTKKWQTATFKTPTQKQTFEQLNCSGRTFRSDFAAYQQEKGITNGWPKLTEDEYDGFVDWFKDRAKERKEEEEAKEKDKGAADKKRADAARAKKFTSITNAIKLYIGSYGELTVDQWKELKDVKAD